MINTGKSTRGFHRLSSWQSCPQKFAYEELLNLRLKKKNPAMELGSLVHVGLAHRYLSQLGQFDGDYMDEVIRYAEENKVCFLLPQAKEILLSYASKWEKEDLIAVDVEEEFRVDIGGELYTQRVDLVAKVEDKIFFVDHKTYGPRKPKWDFSGQFIGLMTLGKNLVPEIYNLPFGGVMVNEICTMKPVGVGSFSRKKVDLPFGLSEAFVHNVKRSYLEMKELAIKDPWTYPKNFSACEGKYSSGCDFWALCTRGTGALEEFEKQK
jgi:hypothetical protein